MLIVEPLNDFCVQFLYKCGEFIYILFYNPAHELILRYISFITAGIKIFGICFVMATQDQRLCLNGSPGAQHFSEEIDAAISTLHKDEWAGSTSSGAVQMPVISSSLPPGVRSIRKSS